MPAAPSRSILVRTPVPPDAAVSHCFDRGQAPATTGNGQALSTGMIHFYRYVVYERVSAYLQLGWMFVTDLGPPHDEHALLMCWPCGCNLVEPLRDT
jgi:hypothetical protein